MIFRIFNKDLPIRRVCFVIGEGILIYIAVLTAALLRFGTMDIALLSGEILGKALLITVTCQAALYYNDLYVLKVTDTHLELGLRLTKAMGVASIVLAIVYYFIPSVMMGRGIFFISLVFLVFLIVPWRYAYNWVLKKKMFSERVIILGLGELSRQIIDEIKDRSDCGYQIVGVTTAGSPSRMNSPSDVPFFSMKGTICEMARQLGATKIIVAMDEKRQLLPTDELLHCRTEGIRVLQGETLYEELTGKLFVEKLNPSWLIFSDGFHKSSITRFTKRVTGLVLATIGLLFSAPLMALIALAIKLDSKGPVFFGQNRCGASGRTFELLKFRSMIDEAEADGNPRWATDDDWRVTRVGKIIRKYRMDELPQLWNVVKGDMSFVGPRPERPEFVEELKKVIPYYSERHTVKPGITGWAQVWYRYGASVDESLEKLKYDLFYVKNMSLAMDLMIMFQTIKTVLLRTGAR
jgi:sugar transferase (PEP-CTERM system associated)